VTGYYTTHSIRANWRGGRVYEAPGGSYGPVGSKNLG